MRSLFLLLIGLTIHSSLAQTQAVAQPTPFVLGITEPVQSHLLNEKRVVNIFLPESYSSSTATTFPVIYLLDGSANEDFIHIAGLIQFLTMIEAMPKSILVGIANIDRKRDFTFPTTIEKDKKDFPTTGGSARFIDFIEKELQPFIQKKYRTNDTTTIIGQSLGGLLATEVLLKQPDLFTNYIIVSPSLWWDNESLLTAAKQLVTKPIASSTQVYLSVGNEGKRMEADAESLVKLLRQSGRANTTIHYVPMPDETHLTILHHSVYKAFELLNTHKK